MTSPTSDLFDSTRLSLPVQGPVKVNDLSPHSLDHWTDGGAGTANPRTNIVDFRGFDSRIILILRGGIPRPIGNFPESLTQAILVGAMLVGRLGVTRLSAGRRSQAPAPSPVCTIGYGQIQERNASLTYSSRPTSAGADDTRYTLV